MTRPAFGANLWIWESPVTADVIARYAPHVAALGFDVIELPLEHPADWAPQEVAGVLAEHGLQAGVCAAMGPGRDLTSSDSGVVQQTQEYIAACLRAAAGVGAAVVAGPMYSPTGVTGPIADDERGAIIERLVANLSPLLDIAESLGVDLAIEPLNRFETSLFNTVEQTMVLIDAVDRPSLGLLLDTFHMNIEERSAPEAIRLAGSHLKHFHACGNDRGAPGNGSIDWSGIVGALGEIDYSGAVTIESFTSANQTIATAASIWRSLAPTQDAIASDGLAFLRQAFGAD